MEDHEQSEHSMESHKKMESVGLRPRTSSVRPSSYQQLKRAAPKPKTKRKIIPKEKRVIRFRFGVIQQSEMEKKVSDIKTKGINDVQFQDNVATNNQNFCNVCGDSGLLISCETCSKSFHSTCLIPPLINDNQSRHNWCCDDCRNREKDALEKETRRISNDPLDRLLAKIRDMIPTAIQQERRFRTQLNKLNVTHNITTLARYCHYCRHVHPDKQLLTCAYCPLAWHDECLPSPFIITKPFRCPAHIPDGIIMSTPTNPVAPYVLTDKALRMIGYSDAYPKFARVPEFIRMYYDEIRVQAMQNEPCHIGVETDR